jgi:hypothetical protein
MGKITYAVVGSGWRSLFYWRIAQAYPEIFEMKAMVCRTDEKAEKMHREYGVPVVTSEEACEALKPDFIVVAVNKMSIAEVAMHWAEKGYPVITETPAAMDVETLKKLWDCHERGAKIQVAEQYCFFPTHMAAIEAVRRGYVGDPYAIDISTVHDYHAASLIRRYLNLGLAPVEISGKEYAFPVEETDSRYGAVTDGSVKERKRVRLDFEYTIDGKALVQKAQENNLGLENAVQKKYAFYDFDSVQYHSFIRSRHLSVKGQTGELDDETLRYVDANHVPHEVKLVTEYENAAGNMEAAGDERMLSNQPQEIRRIRFGGADGEVLYENPFLALGQKTVLSEDETAIATMLLQMKTYIGGGEEVYPLAEALEDAYIRILMEQAIVSGEKICSEHMPWHN